MAEDTNSLMDDMKDDGYRFAHDLVTEVVKRRGIHVPYVKFPNPKNILFTNYYKNIVKEFLALNGEYIENLVTAYAKTGKPPYLLYNDDNYFANCPKIIEAFKPEPYSEQGFICLCAAFAQLATCIFFWNRNCGVTNYALQDVHELVKRVLSQGTLQYSSLEGML